MKSPPEIQTRTFNFAVRIVRLCQELDERGGVGRTLSWQLIRSGTGVGANIAEAQSAQSRPDFLSKLEISLKEARETRYWLDLLIAAEVVKRTRLKALREEAEELIKVLVTITRNTKLKNQKP